MNEESCGKDKTKETTSTPFLVLSLDSSQSEITPCADPFGDVRGETPRDIVTCLAFLIIG
jgi:hypothetical protein